MTGHALFRLIVANNSRSLLNYSRFIIKRPSGYIKFSTASPPGQISERVDYREKWGSKKHKKKVKLPSDQWGIMVNSREVEEVLAPLRESVKEQVPWSIITLI